MSGKGLERQEQQWEILRIERGKTFNAPETRDERRWRRERLRNKQLNKKRRSRRKSSDYILTDFNHVDNRGIASVHDSR